MLTEETPAWIRLEIEEGLCGDAVRAKFAELPPLTRAQVIRELDRLNPSSPFETLRILQGYVREANNGTPSRRRCFAWPFPHRTPR